MTLEEKIEAVHALLPSVWWASDRWLRDCESLGLEFDILEVYRSQQRQDQLFAKGRWKPGKVVTWTLSSLHTKRLACDIRVRNCTYEQVERVAKKYGITRPLAGAPFYDQGHFQFDEVGSMPLTLSAEAQLKRLRRALERSTGNVKSMLQRQITRLLQRV